MPTSILTRDFTVDQKAVNTEARTVKLAFSSEYPVLRRDKSGTEYWEILDHSSDDGVDFSRMKGAPFLLNHNFDQQIGGIREWKLNTIERVARAKAQLFDDPQSEQMLRAIDSELRPNVSVGYTHLSYNTRGKDKDGVEIRVYKWAPYEISSVAVPQDPGVGVGRSLELPTPEQEANKQQPEPMSKENQDPPASTQEPANQNRGGEAPNIITPQFSQSDLRSAEKKRQKEIAAYGEKFGVKREKVEEAIDNDVDASEFLRSVANEWEAPDADIKTDGLNEDVGLNKREMSEWSLSRCIKSIRENGRLDGLERDASEAAAKNLGIQLRSNEFVIPAEFGKHKRDLTVGTQTEGGYLVATEHGELIEKLDALTVANRLPITRYSGLNGDLALNKITGGATAEWVGETGTVSDSAMSFGQIVLRPRRLAVRTVISDQLLAQTNRVADSIARNDMMTREALALDDAFFDGTGAGAEPLGITKQTGIGTITFGGAPTYQDYVDLWNALATDNALQGSFAFLTSSNSIARGMTVAIESGAFPKLIVPDGENFRVNGWPLYMLNQVLDIADQVIAGSWNNAIMASWGARKVTVDEVTGAASGQIKLTECSFHDMNVRHVQSFAASTDTGATA